MRPIKIAILSLTSVHAPLYVQTLPHCDQYEWIAVSIAPKDRSSVLRYGIPDNVKIYDTDEALFRDHPDLEAVILAGSNDLTYRQFKLAASYGVHAVLLMKVPTFDMDEYEDIQKTARNNKMVVQIELELRYEQTVRRMKALLDSGAIGKLLSLNIYNTTVCLPPSLLPWVTNPPETYGKSVLLRPGDSRFRGGALTDHPHAFDLARFFTESEFDTIFADAADNIRPNRPVEECVFVLGRMKNGINVTIDPSYSRHENAVLPKDPRGPGWEGYPKRVETNIILNGEKGSILGDCFHSGVYHTGLPNHTFAVQYIDANSYYSALGAFAENVRHDLTPLVNLDLHKKTMESVTACYESISTGMPVKVKYRP